MMLEAHAATWGIAALATFGVIVRPWNLPEFIWAVAGAALLVLLNLLPWPDALAAAGKGMDVYFFLIGMMTGSRHRRCGTRMVRRSGCF
jgi:arsenical pump membrane protein